MNQPTKTYSNSLKSYRRADHGVKVALSYALIRLLSEQLYQSPLKAIEELVVNAFDAEARVCRIYVPTTDQEQFIAVFDDGIGMDYRGLVDLWQVGHSNKRDGEIVLRSKRKTDWEIRDRQTGYIYNYRPIDIYHKEGQSCLGSHDRFHCVRST